MQLADAHGQFEKLGIAIVAMTYDSPATNRRFAQRRELPFPLLSDERARHAIAFGILNEAYEKGHRAYGVPHPGIFLLDHDGVIRAKFAEAGFRIRPSLGKVLKAAEAISK